MEDGPPRPLDIVLVPVQPPPISIDIGHQFVTEAKEESKDVLISWARKVAEKLKFTIIIRRLDNGGDKSRKPFFALQCERSGKYVPPTKKLKFDCMGTRKCGCPFRLRGYYTKETKLWHMTVVNGIHNHKLDTELEGHLVAGRLKPEEKVFLDEMTKNFVPPRNIISTLKDRDPENTMSSKQVYNARYRSVSLLNSFLTVLLMDSTYKTNKYNMSLFEIVGFTSTERTYNVGFAWLTNEKEDNFIWALQQLRSLVRNEGSLSKVILTDRDTALMNVVAQVFPTSAALVCRVHVEKNVGSKIKALVKVRQGEEVKEGIVWENLEKAFMHLLTSDTIDVYGDRLMEFRELCKKWPKLLRYIEETVLDTDKEKVVHAWGWEAIHQMLGIQFNEIQTQFGQSMSIEEHRYRDVKLYSLLAFKVSRAALDYIYQEAKRVDNVGMDCKKCGCLMRVNYGLPCACLIAKKLRHNQPIRLDEVYNHWKRLCFNDEEGGGDVQDDYSCTAEWEAIKERLKTSDEGAKKKKTAVRGKNKSTTRDKSRWEHVNAYFAETQASQSNSSKSSQSKASLPQASSSTVSKAPVIGNFTPTLSQIFELDHMPKCMHHFIEDIVDVEIDGYCGFRAIELATKNNEADFELVRLNMQREMTLHRSMYFSMFDGEDRWKYIYDALFPGPRQRTSLRKTVAPKDKWLTFPDMGHIVTTILERVVVQLSKHGFGACETFFPLCGYPPPNPSSKVICLGALPNHYVLVKLKEGCPIPKINAQWKRHAAEHTKDWETYFMDRQKQFEELMSIERGDVSTVGVGSKDNPMTIE
ncbi:hypothetical protein TSUD_298910 [Trifolium subterraneum]|nr:hypothetical protein TSUD_298910 [Trifolium subterraneum]